MDGHLVPVRSHGGLDNLDGLDLILNHGVHHGLQDLTQRQEPSTSAPTLGTLMVRSSIWILGTSTVFSTTTGRGTSTIRSTGLCTTRSTLFT